MLNFRDKYKNLSSRVYQTVPGTFIGLLPKEAANIIPRSDKAL